MNYCIARLLGRSIAARFILGSRCGRGEGRNEEIKGGFAKFQRFGWILGSSNSRIHFTPLLFLFVSFSPIVSLCLVSLCSSRSGSHFYRVTDEFASSSMSSKINTAASSSSSSLLLFGQSRAFSNVSKSFAPPFDYGSPV
ncbi:hypothetical protein P5V15_010570 [Pogonomyrmex californicus]